MDVAFLVGVLAGGSLVFASIYLTMLSARIRDAGKFPPPGMPALRDARVLEGRAAQRLATAGRVAALLLGLLGVLVPVGILWLNHSPGG